MDLVWIFQMSLSHTPLELAQIGEQFRFVRFSNRPVLFLTPFAAAQNIDDVAFLLALDFHASLFLIGISRRGRAYDLSPAVVGLEFIHPLIPLRLPSRHHIVQPARLD